MDTDGGPRTAGRAPADGLDNGLDTVLQRCASAPGTVSVWVGRPGAEPALAMHQHDRHFAASTMKLAVLVAAHRAAEHGDIDLATPVLVHDEFASSAPGRRFAVDRSEDSDDDVWAALGSTVELGWLVRRMAVRSSNLATDLVLEAVGVEAAARVLRDARCADSVLQRGIEDLPALQAGLTFAFTAADLARLLGALALGFLLGPAATAVALETLRAQERTEDVVAGLPVGTVVAHKNGWVDGVRHSAALVEPPGEPAYVQVVMTSTSWPDATACALITEISAAVWAARETLLR